MFHGSFIVLPYRIWLWLTIHAPWHNCVLYCFVLFCVVLYCRRPYGIWLSLAASQCHERSGTSCRRQGIQRLPRFLRLVYRLTDNTWPHWSQVRGALLEGGGPPVSPNVDQSDFSYLLELWTFLEFPEFFISVHEFSSNCFRSMDLASTGTLCLISLCQLNAYNIIDLLLGDFVINDELHVG